MLPENSITQLTEFTKDLLMNVVSQAVNPLSETLWHSSGAINHKTFVPLAYEPAEAIHIDWGEATVEISGKRQKIQIWCMRECFSEAIFVTAFYRQNQESFLEGIVKGLEFFGGSPKKMIFDNARVAVKEGCICRQHCHSCTVLLPRSAADCPRAVPGIM